MKVLRQGGKNPQEPKPSTEVGKLVQSKSRLSPLTPEKKAYAADKNKSRLIFGIHKRITKVQLLTGWGNRVYFTIVLGQ